MDMADGPTAAIFINSSKQCIQAYVRANCIIQNSRGIQTMGDNRNTVSKTINGIEYTVILDRSELSSDILKPGTAGKDDLKESIDLLYKEYERMRLNEPTVVDADDIYPRSKQWRKGDRYDMGKVAALEEALKNWKSIEETEAYKRYIEAASKKEVSSISWE